MFAKDEVGTGGIGVKVGEGSGVNVFVFVGDGFGVSVLVFVGVDVRVAVFVFVGVGVRVAVLVELGTGVSVDVGVRLVVAVGEGKGLNTVHPGTLPINDKTITVSINFLIALIVMLYFPVPVFLIYSNRDEQDIQDNEFPFSANPVHLVYPC